MPERSVPVATIIIATALLVALLLALPGQTVVTKYLDHLFVALDGAYRVAAGQVPGRDFHTPLGPLSFYVPAAGYWVSGRLGAAMPVGMALLIVALAPVMAYVLGLAPSSLPGPAVRQPSCSSSWRPRSISARA
jgi:hypothetical protein